MPEQEFHINIGDKAGGDNLSTGNVTGEGIAVGRQATASAGERVPEWLSSVWATLNNLLARIVEIEHQLLGIRRDVDEIKRKQEREEWRQEFSQHPVSSSALFVAAGVFLIAILAIVFWLGLGATYVPR